MAYTGIRRFEEEDVPDVAELHRRVMRPDVGARDRGILDYRDYFRDVFLSEAALSAGLPSLVCNSDPGIGSATFALLITGATRMPWPIRY